MFTIKHQFLDGGETLYEATNSLTYQPQGDGGFVYWTAADGEIKSLDHGTVYVTNKLGSTVAKYELSRSQPVQGGIGGGVAIVGSSNGLRAV